MATSPTPPPRAADDVIQDLQRSGWSRWTPRRAGVPALIDWWPAYLLLAMLVVLAVLVTLRLAVDFLSPLGHVLVIAGIACVLTFSLAPLVSRLEHSMPRRAAASLVFFGTLSILLTLAAVVAWQLSGEGQRLSDQLTEVSETLKGNRALVLGRYEIPANIQERIRALTDQGARIDEWSAAVAIGLVTSLINLVLVLVITFYLLTDARRLRAIVLRWLEPEHRPGTRRVLSETARVFGAYVRAQLLVAASLGLLVAVVLLVLGVPYALFLALFAAMAELIPMIGPVAGAVPALLVSATLPLPAVIWVAVAFVVIQLVESNILVPRLTGRAVGLHPVGSILALALGFELGGVIGALFAVPLAGLAWVFVFTAVRAWRDKRIDLQRTVDPATLRRRRLALRQRALLGRTNT
ncbi:MAG: AI-2E family transporter [Chloroflexota bacterium]|nr:AI-2E family transporter [Chloroflexota bacterium]